MPVLTNIGALARCLAEGPQDDANVLHNAALAWDGASIRWIGFEKDLPKEYHGWPAEDVGKRLVVPGLVDCHTHLAFAGWRAEEFERRIQGKSYLEIAAAGGGIASTVAKTRATSTEQLLEHCRAHLPAPKVPKRVFIVAELPKSDRGKVLRDKAYTDPRIGKIGLDPFESPSPAAAAALVRTYYDKLAPVVKKAGIKVE